MTPALGLERPPRANVQCPGAILGERSWGVNSEPERERFGQEMGDGEADKCASGLG